MSQSVKSFVYYKLYKPYGYLSQFSGESSDKLLGELHNFPKNVYSVGRLDKDSEGLLLLTNDNRFKTRMLSPESKKWKTYWVQVEGQITQEAILKLTEGRITVPHKGVDFTVSPALCKEINAPNISERVPPIRSRKSIPTSWIELKISEGKNRQVRKMTAAVGFPTLRLVRYSVDKYTLEDMQLGEVREFRPITF
ncbi:MAG: pseudouridine synthase [Fluviicola sp.]|nr:pseudouridine synthase [Fluviicola sp.]